MFIIKNFISGELKYKTDAMRNICINESIKAERKSQMEINREKQEEFVRASEQRIYEWAKTVGLTEVDAVVKTAIISELRTMYETGFDHCNDTWNEYMEDMRIERDLSERD